MIYYIFNWWNVFKHTLTSKWWTAENTTDLALTTSSFCHLHLPIKDNDVDYTGWHGLEHVFWVSSFRRVYKRINQSTEGTHCQCANGGSWLTIRENMQIMFNEWKHKKKYSLECDFLRMLWISIIPFDHKLVEMQRGKPAMIPARMLS